eukprot:CAMPEP_0198656566 /NCGR_PEP_ID=MMETSP1467-20131203/10139_1 /TAXON_ID=1462469 /ORGANISM="unid. sp., Strain CCMP2135" /LENGTH=114 /DNA_ID=CAMNT_0044392613 /DNA_START=118 /DNA_END=459 /DNA_ORIENTATION=+
MTFACRLTPQWQEVNFFQNGNGLADFHVSYEDCGAANEGEHMVCNFLPNAQGPQGGGAFVEAHDTLGAFTAMDIDNNGQTVHFFGYKGSQAQGYVHLVVQMESAPSVALCEFAG